MIKLRCVEAKEFGDGSDLFESKLYSGGVYVDVINSVPFVPGQEYSICLLDSAGRAVGNTVFLKVDDGNGKGEVGAKPK